MTLGLLAAVLTVLLGLFLLWAAGDIVWHLGKAAGVRMMRREWQQQCFARHRPFGKRFLDQQARSAGSSVGKT